MTVYLAGGINGLTDGQAKDWRAVAIHLLDGDVLDPMVRDYRGREDQNVEQIVAGDLADIKASRAVLAYCIGPSWGTAMELVYAHQMGRPIVAVVPDGMPVSPWLRYHADAVVPTVEAAVEYLRGRP